MQQGHCPYKRGTPESAEWWATKIIEAIVLDAHPRARGQTVGMMYRSQRRRKSAGRGFIQKENGQ